MDEVERPRPSVSSREKAKVESFEGLASTTFRFLSITMIESTAASKIARDFSRLTANASMVSLRNVMSWPTA